MFLILELMIKKSVNKFCLVKIYDTNKHQIITRADNLIVLIDQAWLEGFAMSQHDIYPTYNSP